MRYKKTLNKYKEAFKDAKNLREDTKELKEKFSNLQKEIHETALLFEKLLDILKIKHPKKGKLNASK